MVAERVLVTGSGGVLGTALLEQLRQRGVEAVASPGRAECNMLDWSEVIRTWQDFKPTLVFHLAGWVAGVQGNLSFAGQAFYENALINLNVIEASRQVGVTKIVAAGTTAIYSDEVSLPMREADLWRGSPHGSEGAYGHAKRAMLAHLEAYQRQYGLDFCYMICTNMFGPNDRFDEVYGHVVPSLIARFHRAVQQGQEEIVAWGDGTPTRDFLYADDAARAFLLVAEQGSGAYNTASGSSRTIRELVETVADVSGYRGRVVWDTSRPNGQRARSYDVSRLQALGWRPVVDLRSGLALSLEWYGQHQATVRS